MEVWAFHTKGDGEGKRVELIHDMMKGLEIEISRKGVCGFFWASLIWKVKKRTPDWGFSRGTTCRFEFGTANDNFSNEKKTAKKKPMIKMPKLVVEGND